MAMTKKERAQFDAVLREAKVLGALRWSEQVKPDLDPPEKSGIIVNGWLYNVHTMRVERGCTSLTSHAWGQWDKTQSQNPVRLYSTRLRALQALRYALARKYAEELVRVDDQILTEMYGE